MKAINVKTLTLHSWNKASWLNVFLVSNTEAVTVPWLSIT